MRTLSDLQRAYDARSDDDDYLIATEQAWLAYQKKAEQMRQSLKVIAAMADGLIAIKAEPCLDDLQEILDEAKKGLGE